MSGTVWQRLAAAVRQASAMVRKEQADYAAGRTGMGFFSDRDRDKSEAARNVRELYRLRAMVDELIDDEIVRAVDLGAAFGDLGSSRQQAAGAATARARHASTRIDQMRHWHTGFVNAD